MDDQTFEAVRSLRREDLEALAVRAIVHIRRGRSEAQSRHDLLTVLLSFLAGALVAASGFVVGASLG